MTWRVLLGLAFAFVTPGAAQDALPQARPGGVATVVAVVGQGPDSVRFRAMPANGVRLFSAAIGVASAADGEDLHLPFTFGLPTRAPAGPLVALRLELERGDGRRESRELLVDVVAQHRAGFALDDATVTAPPGAVAEVRYRIRNDGNAPDTFRIRLTTPASWAADAGPAPVALEAGAETTGSVRIRVPPTSLRGAEHMIRIAAVATDVDETRSARVIVVGEASRIGNLTTVPGSLFVGSSAGEEGTTSAVALSAAGELQPGTRVTLDLRHVDGQAAPPAFRGAMGGPRLRVGLEGENWTARAGDLFTAPDLVTGPTTHGRGLEGATDRGPLRTEVLAARPWSYHGLADDGHVLRAAGRYGTSIGDFGARVASVRRDGGLIAGHQQGGASLTYALRSRSHDVQVEAGVLHVAEDSSSATGPAAQLRYTMNRGRTSFTGRLRTVPAATGGTPGSEAFVSGDVGITGTVSLTGSAHTAGSPRLGGRPYTLSDGASAGVRLRLPARADLRLLGSYRANEFVGSGLNATATRTLALGAAAPIAGLVLEVDGQAGLTRPDGGTDRHYHNLRLGGRWSQGNDWVWAGLTHQDFGAGVRLTRLDLAGAVQLPGAALQAGLNSRIDAFDQLRTASFWSAATVPILDNTDLAIGAEYRGYRLAGPWRFSLGATRSFGLPLPVARTPVVSGVIYEDLDGDGVRRPGDPGVPGVAVQFGHLQTTTDARGHFRFYDGGAGGDLSVDPAALPIGVTVGPGTEMASRGRTAIPLVRTASLEIRLFLDRNGNGAMDPDEARAPGLVVSVRDQDGTSRDAVSDGTGRVRFGALPPGTYTVVVLRPPPRPGDATIETDIVLRPADDELILIGVPARTREIRLPNGASLDLEWTPAVATDANRPHARFVWLPAALALVDQSGASANRTAPVVLRP